VYVLDQLWNARGAGGAQRIDHGIDVVSEAQRCDMRSASLLGLLTG
jgi:hypothetical protein